MDQEIKKETPFHVAIIMDGNGRWAKRRGLPRSEGHRKGLDAIFRAIQAALDLGIDYLTIYAFSTENWRRSPEEVDFLMRACESVIKKELPFLLKNDIRLRHIGRLEGLSGSLVNCIRNAQDLTQNNRRLSLQLAFNYGGRLEILDAVRAIAERVKAAELEPQEISEETIQNYLATAGIPDPDLLIRTSGEMRVSNFLLWQIAYTELVVISKYWPDFNKSDLARAIKDFQKRRRRFGGLDA